jgi:hypothetical protein
MYHLLSTPTSFHFSLLFLVGYHCIIPSLFGIGEDMYSATDIFGWMHIKYMHVYVYDQVN